MDWGLDDYWLKVAMEKAGEIYGSPMCADALRADASARREKVKKCKALRHHLA